MKPSKLGKGIILVLITVIIFGCGIAFFIYPNIEALENAQNLLIEKNKQISEALLAIEKIEQVDKLYTEAVEKTIFAQENFYPEMTTVETVREVQRILNNAFGGQKSTAGIHINPLSAVTLAVHRLPSYSDIDYEIRQYSFLQRANPDDNSGDEITLKEALKLLHSNNEEVTLEERKYLLSIIRELLSGESIEVGLINASFTLKLTYSEYLYFMDYICKLPKAVSFSNITFKTDSALESNVNEDYHFSLNFYVIKEMEAHIAFND